jgi:hypothetical protein
LTSTFVEVTLLILRILESIYLLILGRAIHQTISYGETVAGISNEAVAKSIDPDEVLDTLVSLDGLQVAHQIGVSEGYEV